MLRLCGKHECSTRGFGRSSTTRRPERLASLGNCRASIRRSSPATFPTLQNPSPDLKRRDAASRTRPCVRSRSIGEGFCPCGSISRFEAFYFFWPSLLRRRRARTKATTTMRPRRRRERPARRSIVGDFQVVAVLRDDTLVIYLDRFATNEPVVRRKIEVETPSGQQARDHECRWHLPHRLQPWPKGSDHYDLIFTVTRRRQSRRPAADDCRGMRGDAACGNVLALAAAFWLPRFSLAFAGGLFIARRFPQFLRATLPSAILRFFSRCNRFARRP